MLSQVCPASQTHLITWRLWTGEGEVAETVSLQERRMETLCGNPMEFVEKQEEL